jgi:hypothetical protein
MEYPPTSSEGIAICYNTESWSSPDNTNVAESCHASENRDGKSLSLEVAILR